MVGRSVKKSGAGSDRTKHLTGIPLEHSFVTASIPNLPVAPIIATFLAVMVDDDNPSDTLMTMKNTKTFVTQYGT